MALVLNRTYAFILLLQSSIPILTPPCTHVLLLHVSAAICPSYEHHYLDALPRRLTSAQCQALSPWADKAYGPALVGFTS